MAPIILHGQALTQLPRRCQNFLNGLNQSQLHHLRAAIAPQLYFDLMGLPLEIRQMIFEYFLTSSTGYLIRADHFSNKDRVRRELSGISLLTTSKQISAEAFVVLMNCNIYQWGSDPSIWNLMSRDRIAFRSFRKIKLSFYLRNDKIEWYKPIELSSRHVKSVLTRAIKCFQQNPYNSVGGARFQLTLDMKSYWCEEELLEHTGNGWTVYFRHERLHDWFVWAQTLDFVWQVRTLFVAKGLNIDTLCSLESYTLPEWLELCHVNSEIVKFKDKRAKRMGIIFWLRPWTRPETRAVHDSFENGPKVREQIYDADMAIEDISVTFP